MGGLLSISLGLHCLDKQQERSLRYIGSLQVHAMSNSRQLLAVEPRPHPVFGIFWLVFVCISVQVERERERETYSTLGKGLDDLFDALLSLSGNRSSTEQSKREVEELHFYRKSSSGSSRCVER